MAFYYVRPDEAPSLSSTVTTTAGDTDSDYTDDWICDARPGRPARSTTGTVTWTAAFSSAEVGLIAVCNCNSDVNATIAGGISTSVVAGALETNGIRLSGFAAPTPATITGLSVGFSAAAADVVLGEFYFGKRRTLVAANGTCGWPRLEDLLIEDDDFEMPIEGDFVSVPPYDRGLFGRRLTGSHIYTSSQLADLKAWRKAQRAATKPSLIVPDSTVNDAWLVQFRALEFKPIDSDLWQVRLEFVEYPRSRW